jgi:hypothetical protein
MTDEFLMQGSAAIPTAVLEQKESLKLMKNTKGYNWEIRILSADIDRLVVLNNEMQRKFGGKDDDSDNDRDFGSDSED